MAELDTVLQAVLTICILVFAAKILGEIFSWRKIPSVLGELVAGMILGPFALGSISSHKWRPTYPNKRNSTGVWRNRRHTHPLRSGIRNDFSGFPKSRHRRICHRHLRRHRSHSPWATDYLFLWGIARLWV